MNEGLGELRVSQTLFYSVICNNEWHSTCKRLYCGNPQPLTDRRERKYISGLEYFIHICSEANQLHLLL